MKSLWYPGQFRTCTGSELELYADNYMITYCPWQFKSHLSCFKKSFSLFGNTRSVHAEHCRRIVLRPEYRLENRCLVIRTKVATTQS